MTMADSLHVVCPHCLAVNRVPASRVAQKPLCGRCRSGLFEGKPVELDRRAFDTQVQRSDIPLVVDFWASWCAPCHAMAPVFEAAAAQLEPHVRFAKVNTEEEREISASLDIRAIPTLIAFAKGREISRTSGAMPLPQLIDWVQRAALQH
jgi:thioredoxin 2